MLRVARYDGQNCKEILTHFVVDRIKQFFHNLKLNAVATSGLTKYEDFSHGQC